MKLQFVGAKNREENVREYIFTPPQSFNWQAGQYLHYVLPHDNADDRGVERWFTISSAPSEGEVRITTRIDHEHGSSFKHALESLRPGDEIEADGPEGDFVLGDTSREYIFIVGGIGITPVRSILTEAAAKAVPLHATVLYANRSSDAPFHDELDALQAENPNLVIQYIVEPEVIDADILKTAIDAANDPLIYTSGPEPMVKAIMEQLETLGVNKDHLRADDFPGYEGI